MLAQSQQRICVYKPAVATPLPHAVFLDVIANAPLIAIDLVVLNDAGEALLGLRRNAPAQNFWFVPGGRIYKNETLHAAFQRITTAETGVAMHLQNAEFKGIFEHFYDDNFAAQPAVSTHYLTLAYKVRVAVDSLRLRPDQHSAYEWIGVDEIPSRPDVHPYTQAYFNKPAA